MIIMRYTLLLHYPETPAADLGPEAMEEAMRAFQKYATMLDEAGALMSAEVLLPSTASTTLRLVDGAPHVQDGPFADSLEQLGGTFVLDVADMDEALAWAKQCPSLPWGAVELRPTATRFVNGAWTS